jgi:ABC-type uncharacterized transport system permease subunit
MEQQNAVASTKGKGLGLAGMIIGIVALIWAIIPLLGAAAWWMALTGLILSVVAFFMAKNGNNPKKGMIITGIILNVVALCLAIFWIYQISSAANEIMEGLENLDTAAMRQSIESSMGQ